MAKDINLGKYLIFSDMEKNQKVYALMQWYLEHYKNYITNKDGLDFYISDIKNKKTTIVNFQVQDSDKVIQTISTLQLGNAANPDNIFPTSYDFYIYYKDYIEL